MAESFASEIRMVAFDFAPVNWAECNGQEMAIRDYQKLYALLGSTYGGNDTTYFNLPNLKGRTPVGMGTSKFNVIYPRGYMGGQELVQITEYTMPNHSHILQGQQASATDVTADGKVLAESIDVAYSQNPSKLVPLNGGAVSANSSLSQEHDNCQPSTVVNFIISLDGYFPARN